MHHLLALVWFFYFHYLLGSLIGAFFFLAAFALFGIETGLHRKYVDTLLATFEVSPISLCPHLHTCVYLIVCVKTTPLSLPSASIPPAIDTCSLTNHHPVRLRSSVVRRLRRRSG